MEYERMIWLWDVGRDDLAAVCSRDDLVVVCTWDDVEGCLVFMYWILFGNEWCNKSILWINFNLSYNLVVIDSQ